MVRSLFLKKMICIAMLFRADGAFHFFLKKMICIAMLFRADGIFSFFLKKRLHSNAISGRWYILFFFKKTTA